MRILLGIVLCMCLISGPLLSESASSADIKVPHVIRLSGTMPNVEAVEKLVGVTFALYKDEQGGSPLWLETQNVTVDANGHYSVLLGAHNSEGLPDDIFIGGEARWIGVRVEGAEELPRIAVVSVPYALKAQDADTLGGLPASAYLLSDSNAAESPVRTNSTVSVSTDVSTQTLNASGSSNYIAKFTSADEVANSTIYEDPLSLRIGIGTVAPAEKLELNGNLLLRGQQFHQIQVIGGQSAGRLGQDNQGFFFASDTANRPFRFFTTPQGGALTQQMTIAPYGYIGFGTGKPAERVEINGNLLLRGQQFHQVQVIGGQSAGRFGQDNQGFFLASDTAGKPFRIFTTPFGGVLSQRVTVSADGNVGIGIASPSNRLSVAGSIESTTGGFKFPDGSTLLSASNYTNPAVFIASTSGHVVKAVQNEAGSNQFLASGIPSALRADATSSSGNAAGVFGTSSSYAGYGVVGVNTSSCDPANLSFCNALGVFGVSAAATHGTAVWGQAESTDGDNVGIYGIARGTQGTGVWGYTSNESGDGIGVIGETAATSGTGIFAEAYHPSGYTAAIFGRTRSANGIALQLEVSSGSTSNLIIARSGSYPDYNNVFRVDSTGRVFANGNLQASGADFAESVAVLGDRGGYEPGDVLAIDPTGTRRFTLASGPYSTLVAGVYSTRPGLLVSPHADGDSELAEEVPLAVVGIVPCKVTDENGPIRPGDLLVSSSRPGYAMKGTDGRRMVGAVVGKALGTLESGRGTIEVLVSLQ